MQAANLEHTNDSQSRNFSPYQMFLDRARANRPRYRFEQGRDPVTWRDAALPAALATLGHAPESVDPAPRHLGAWERHGVTQERWQLDVSPGFSATAVVNRPTGLTEGDRRPGILCWHGHTDPAWIGKEAMMGNDAGAELEANAEASGYGLAMAREGYVTFAIDWLGYGESDDNSKPNHRSRPGNHVWCNVYYLKATMLGMTPLGINVAHGKALTDFVSKLPYVDPARLGVLGFSGGGTLALWSGLADPRLIAVEISCYSDLFADFGYRDGSYCGAQVAPGLYELVDVPDLQGLLAPKPLLVDIGSYDRTFRLDSAITCHQRVAEIYQAAGAADRLHLNLFPGGHRWDATASGPFFADYLAGAPG